jgi:CheY-like chemotaxis protein
MPPEAFQIAAALRRVLCGNTTVGHAMTARILVVDDVPEMLAMMADLLSGAGYNVLAASTLEVATTLADGAQPDLVLIDVRLGAHNGLHLAVREKLRHPSRPLIVMTGHPDPILEAEAKRFGAEFLDKASPPETFLSVIAGMLANRQPADHP